ncbi:LytTR family transcriptional regulator [Winogradskyella flava]|uniref:LytTR family transcriptional regulator n=1 Tax=Winogradskyella flava TaxID=1884876 RepID=A0A842IMN4_9FLAO|nr:LytTR family transcriptional regulator [Winogradskyella flava]MBC2843915.1 LytTR family transcriptional regulator [Winogradskyella flava]
MKNSGYIFFVFLLFSFIGYTQIDSPEIDSLIQRAIKSGAKNQDSAIYYSKKAYDLAKKEKDTFLIGSTGYYYSFFLISIDKIEEAQLLLRFNFDNQDKLNSVLKGNTYYNQAAIFDISEQFGKALEYYFYSLDFYKTANNKKGLAKSYLQIGVIYEKLDKLKLADYFFDASLEVSGNTNKKHEVDSTGRGMPSSEKTDESLKMLKELEKGENDKLKSIVLYNLGQSLMGEKRYSEAIGYFKRSIEIKKRLNFLTNIDKTYFLLGQCYYNINNAENAILNLNKAKKENKKRTQLAEIEYFLSKSYESKQDYKKALLYSNNYKFISDSIAEFKQNERIAEITAKFESQKQANKIIKLQQENQKNELEIYKQENLRWRWSLVALVTSIIAAWLGRRFLKSQERVKEIELEKEHIAMKVEEIAVILNNKTKVYLKELKYIKSDGNYLEFVTDKKRIIDRNKIKDILEELPPNFVKVHRSYIINKNYVSSISRSNVILQPDIHIPLSRTFKSNLT